MRRISTLAANAGRPARAWARPRPAAILTLVVASLVGASAAQAQAPIDLPTPELGPALPLAGARPGQAPGLLPGIPLAGAKPTEGPGSVAAYVRDLSTTDNQFEVGVGRGRILTVREDIIGAERPDLIAVGDPSVLDFTPINQLQIRIVGKRVGTTDLSITTGGEVPRTYTFEVAVVADLSLLRGLLLQTFPDASLRLTQAREHVVVEGQARNPAQVARIMELIRAYLESSSAAPALGSGPSGTSNIQVDGAEDVPVPPTPPGSPSVPTAPAAEPGSPPADGPNIPSLPAPPPSGPRIIPRVINLIRIPTSQQVLLKVRVAEMNRTAFRQIGADFLATVPEFGALFGTNIGGNAVAATASAGQGRLSGVATTNLGAGATAFGIFNEGNFEFILSALRRNSILKILAEPNLMALSGHSASFLAGGEFPVPVPQIGAGGVAPTITVQFREFGVRLGFLPYVMDDGLIRLTVDPEVSSIDFALGTTLVAGGSPIPGLNTRKSHTTVELREGQTLAVAGLLQLSLDGSTQRIPVVGDLPIIGPFFSNTTNNRIEKELVVTVTPYLVEPLAPDQVPPGPGDEVNAPNDLEFYFMNRLEGRTGVDHRSTVKYDDPLGIVRRLTLERNHVRGPSGFTD